MTARTRKDEVADDWHSNFNDLSVEAEVQSRGTEKASDTSRKPRWSASRKQERDQQQKDTSSKTASSDATSFEGLKAKLGYAANARANAGLKGAELDDISSRALEGIPRDADSTEHASTDVRQTYESVLADLLNEPTPTVSPAAKPTAKDDALEQSEKPFVGRKARLANAKKWPGTNRLPLVSEKSDDRQTSPLAKNKAATTSTSAVDDILVDGGVTSSSKKASVQPEDLHHGKPLSIASKARVVRERPKWGGMMAAPKEAGSAFKASFDSLQRADKVSAPPKRPSTASSAKPWGIKGVQADSGSVESPNIVATGRVSEPAATTPAHEKTEEAQSGTLSGMLGFAKLKNMLYGSGPETIETVGHDNPATPVGGLSNPAPKLSTSRRTVLRRERRERRKARLALAAKQEAADAAAKGEDASTLDVSLEPPAVGPPEGAKLDSTLRGSENDGRSISAAMIDSETFDPTSQSSEDTGRSMSDAMVGRDLSAAMYYEQGPEYAIGEDYVDDSESGLPMIEAKGLQITALDIEQPPVPELSYGLDRVLFNPGVTPLQDQHSRVYNFDPYLQHVMPVEEFDFNALPEYKTSSQDMMLSKLAKAHGKKYVGSTSSMTSTLSHFHYLLSGWRDLNLGMLSRQFPEDRPTFTAINRAPTAIFLRWKNGTYAIDADKEFDSGNILMMLGKSMEKLLTLPKSEYERYRKSDPREITEEERNAPEAYQYTTMGDFLMRSQLDAYDPRLPGTGMFDIKTRSIASIRMSTTDYKPMLGYEILTHQGAWESYEREYYDMMRSTMLKYMLQARMGRMDGIFLAYHNVERIFGFQYMPMSEIDRASTLR